MDLKGILNSLYAEKKVKLSFSNAAEREAFRQRLYKAKKSQDKILSDVLDEDRKILKCKYEDSVEVTEGVSEFEETAPSATFWLEQKPKEQFNVVLIED